MVWKCCYYFFCTKFLVLVLSICHVSPNFAKPKAAEVFAESKSHNFDIKGLRTLKDIILSILKREQHQKGGFFRYHGFFCYWFSYDVRMYGITYLIIWVSILIIKCQNLYFLCLFGASPMSSPKIWGLSWSRRIQNTHRNPGASGTLTEVQKDS